MQQTGLSKDLQPIAEEGALIPIPDDPKRLKNEELKRKALLVAHK